MDIHEISTHEVPSSPSRDYNPRKRGRTACTRCKSRKQKCDNEYPVCSNCQRAGTSCDKSTVRQENGQQKEYIRSLEDRVAYLQSELEARPARSDPGSNVTQSTPTTFQSLENRNAAQRASATGIDNNAVGELVGFLALNSEAPAYVGSSSGLPLASNLGEMVQATVWNQFLNPSRVQQTFASHCNRPNSSQRALDPTVQPSSTSGSLGQGRTEELLANGAEPPNDEMGSKILQAYLARIHIRYPLLGRDELWRLHGDHLRLAKLKREELTRKERFGIFKLYLVYAIGATLIQLSEKHTYVCPEKYYMTALQQAPAMCETRSIENIEAMTLLVVYHLRSSSSQGIWYMIGLAMRIAIDLGLHRKANEVNLDPFTAQMRRRLFWNVYYLERVISMSLGRPFSIADRHIDLPLPWDVDDTVQDPALLTAPPPSDRTTTLTFAVYLIQLSRIESRIQHKIYRADKPLHTLRSKMDRLFLELQEWREFALLRDFSGSDLDYTTLHYNRALRILIQPFLPALSLADPYYYICLNAAGDICQTHKRLHQTLEYGHSFLAVQTVFMAGITLLYALWTHTNEVWSVRMSNDIRACSTVLFVMGERAAWVKKYRDAFELLVNAAMEKLEGNENTKAAGMAELMTAQHNQGTNAAPDSTAAFGMPKNESFSVGDIPTANPIGLAHEPGLGGISRPQLDSNYYGVRMALHLAPWIDLDADSPFWMPDFETLENLSGTQWNYGDPAPFDAL